MLDLTLVRDRARTTPTLVDQIVLAVTQAIDSRALRPGMTMPSVRELARAHDISTFTVANAYSRLVARNQLVARAGAGYRVAGHGLASGQARLHAWVPPERGAAWLLSDIFADQSIPIKAGCGWLPPEWMHDDGLHQALRHLSRVPGVQLAGYGHPLGYGPLRDTVVAELSQYGLQAEPTQVLLTQGATQALDLVVRTLLQRGDTVIVESPGYANLLQMLRLAGLNIVSVPRTAEGLDLDALAAVVAEHRPRAIFLNTTLQNPTGTTLGVAQAFRLLQIAERAGLWVVEDDVSRELLPGMAPMLAAMDGLNRVIYVGGYTKSISPSVRVGYVVAQPELVRQLARTKMAVGLTSPEIMERLVHQVIRDGRYRAHVLRIRERLAAAHVRVAQLMQARGMELFSQPQAGLFLWARPAQGRGVGGANRLAEDALRDGIWLAPGSYFDAQDQDTDWLRFNVAYSEAPALWAFMAKAGWACG